MMSIRNACSYTVSEMGRIWRSTYVQRMSAPAEPTPPVEQTPGNRDAAGRFRAQDASFHACLDLIAQVARHAAQDGEDPRDVSGARFDRARQELGIALPSAQALVKRFRSSRGGAARPTLRTLIDMGLAPASDRAVAAGHDTGNEAIDEFPSDLMIIALRAAGLRCSGVPGTLDYDRMISEENHSRTMRGVPGHGLPHSTTIIRRFGSWKKALEAAGFEETGGVPPARRAEPAAEILDRFITEHAFLPASGYFTEYCRLSGIPLGRDAKGWADVVEGARARRAERGEDMPAAIAGPHERPPVETIAGGGPGRAMKRATREAAIASLRRWRDEGLRAGQTPTTRGYREFCAGRTGLVSESTISARWGFAALCEEAGI